MVYQDSNSTFQWGLTEERLNKAMIQGDIPAPCRYCGKTQILGIDGICQTCADFKGLLDEEVDIRSKARAR